MQAWPQSDQFPERRLTMPLGLPNSLAAGNRCRKLRENRLKITGSGYGTTRLALYGLV